MATRGGGKSMAKGSVTTADVFGSSSKYRPFLVASCSELDVGVIWQTSRLRTRVVRAVGSVTRTWSTGRTRKRSSEPRERGVGQTPRTRSAQTPKMLPAIRTQVRLHDAGVVPANNRLQATVGGLGGAGPLRWAFARSLAGALAIKGRRARLSRGR